MACCKSLRGQTEDVCSLAPLTRLSNLRVLDLRHSLLTGRLDKLLLSLPKLRLAAISTEPRGSLVNFNFMDFEHVESVELRDTPAEIFARREEWQMRMSDGQMRRMFNWLLQTNDAGSNAQEGAIDGERMRLFDSFGVSHVRLNAYLHDMDKTEQ
ncbi:hypothetical protein WJX73_006791 [Symbiochloris irregularis]|uniref:Uncharacterized protein n=1 Tax=Symbiochloris irregularis TaxID=706552 RepID=A0AAW1NST4_9CHLO